MWSKTTIILIIAIFYLIPSFVFGNEIEVNAPIQTTNQGIIQELERIIKSGNLKEEDIKLTEQEIQRLKDEESKGTIQQGGQGGAKTSGVASDLPGLIKGGERVGFILFLNKWLFPFMLSAAAILAVLMIVIAGARWVASAGSEAEIKAARDMITNAIIGLILAFAAWLIINTINPDILKVARGQIESSKKIVLIERICPVRQNRMLNLVSCVV
ncbi:MAG: hypothetical protein A3H02_01635 [Candidatus Niyogibacteria bacterium RIFCSPLOWO2_12_FULL_41_13]|uniref:Uncharacterized protein n=1 Tax=Candidatus Niyogibacteria bacterium RIFCSPLOWO2_12_FULL_41_13 TaxID=1801726 RepID=A0A1G2F2D2_9BACT|nr:MAG: hypothetical protein A3H02_01635 [Candidatus Niyogibacteria bacterium RIFCSPLOWO2_12_FULL_41_13]